LEEHAFIFDFEQQAEQQTSMKQAASKGISVQGNKRCLL
jgi:hypothetical protein